jgi:HNH endonuclease
MEDDGPKELRWFQRGIEAIQRLGGGDEWNSYPCPLCRRDFPLEALASKDLTLEHAPPESLGGRTICLTCRSCNNDSGGGVDAEMRKAENMLELALGAMKEPRPVLLEMGSARIAADYYHGGAGILISGVPKASSPEAQKRLQEELERLHGEKSVEFRYTIIPHRDAHDAQLASVGWLRAAFLVSFAALGFVYAFSRRLSVVRNQLDAPSTTIIRTFAITDPNADAALRQLLVIQEPPQLAGSLAVRMGRHLVFLPFTADGLYEQLAAMAEASPRFEVTMRGLSLPWPTEPLHLVDFGQLEGIRVDRVAGAPSPPPQDPSGESGS